MFTIKRLKRKFILNGKVTVCIITGQLLDNGVLYENVISVGKTKCNDDDTYNETLGKRIAEAKAKKKMYKKYSNKFAEMSNLMWEAVDECHHSATMFNLYFENESNHLKQLIDETKK